MAVLIDNPDQILALGYAAGPANRRLISAVFAFDAMIGGQVLAAREPIFGQIRLAWWRDQLKGMADDVTRKDPMLIEIATLLESGIAALDWPSDLIAIVDGWEALLGEERPTDAVLTVFAQNRGRGVFGSALSEIGEGWALVDLALRMKDEGMMALAMPRLAGLAEAPRSKETRAFRVLAALALGDVKAGAVHRPRPGSPRRAFWALRYVLAHW